MDERRSCTAFLGSTRIASGALAEVALTAKAALDADETAQILIFDDVTAEPIDLDFRGRPEDVLRRLGHAPEAQADASPPGTGEVRRGPGRPKLGVVAREVTLLPRHWAWLGRQPGGASVALRKLVEEARRGNGGKERIRQSQEAAYRFMAAMAGNEAGFEEAVRALFAGNEDRFRRLVEAWPAQPSRSHRDSLFEHDLFGKPVPTFPDHARRPQAMKLGLRKPASLLP